MRKTKKVQWKKNDEKSMKKIAKRKHKVEMKGNQIQSQCLRLDKLHATLLVDCDYFGKDEVLSYCTFFMFPRRTERKIYKPLRFLTQSVSWQPSSDNKALSNGPTKSTEFLSSSTDVRTSIVCFQTSCDMVWTIKGPFLLLIDTTRISTMEFNLQWICGVSNLLLKV